MTTLKKLYEFKAIVHAPLTEVENMLFDISSGHFEKNLPILLSQMGTVDVIQEGKRKNYKKTLMH